MSDLEFKDLRINNLKKLVDDQHTYILEMEKWLASKDEELEILRKRCFELQAKLDDYEM